MRIVSLVPSVTETLLAWGVPVRACTRFCEQPQLTHVGGTKDPDIAAIVALRPDVVVVDREENRREDAEALTSAGVAVHVTHVTSVHDVASMLAGLAEAVGARLPEISPVPSAEVPWTTAFVPIWKRPWMTMNACTYGSSILDLLGVRNLFAAHADTYPIVDVGEVAAEHPSLVLLPSEPYPFAERHLDEIRRTFPGATPLLVDGQDLFWWGARTDDALERLRATLRAAPTPG